MCIRDRPVQTENAELKEWIRVMFELSREDICKWRKEHNKLLIEEFKEIFRENTEEIMNEN